jgi:beta-fructofuranosidase
MLLTARRNRGPSNRRGCIALATSPDLSGWEVVEPLWTPELYSAHECPDLFPIEDRWCLVYSTFSERAITHYRFGPSPEGPWTSDGDDAFDTPAFYAAKTAADGARRYLFGWLASRSGERDDGEWEWGGTLVVHELEWRDGSFAVRAPEAVASRFAVPVPLEARARIGEWRLDDRTMTTRAEASFACARLAAMPESCAIEVTVDLAPGTRSAGLILRATEDLEAYYQLRIEPSRRRVVFDRWPRPGNEPFVFERPLPEAVRSPVRLRVLVDGSAIVAYVDDAVALSARGYLVDGPDVGVFVSEGSATFSGISVREPAP